jgi:hypothetical protein
MRHWKIRRVVEVIAESKVYVGRPLFTSVLRADCGHVFGVNYWPYEGHYQPGMRVRCYECGRGNSLR